MIHFVCHRSIYQSSYLIHHSLWNIKQSETSPTLQQSFSGPPSAVLLPNPPIQFVTHSRQLAAVLHGRNGLLRPSYIQGPHGNPPRSCDAHTATRRGCNRRLPATTLDKIGRILAVTSGSLHCRGTLRRMGGRWTWAWEGCTPEWKRVDVWRCERFVSRLKM